MHEVIIDGETVFKEGNFTKVDKDLVLEQIHQALANPRDQDELERHKLREQVFPFVERFYNNYLDSSGSRMPYYKGSSSI